MIPILSVSLVAALFLGLYIYDRRTRPERSRRAKVGAIRRRATTIYTGTPYHREDIGIGWGREIPGWTNYIARCELCTHTWVATAPDEAKALECPNCHHMNDLTTM